MTNSLSEPDDSSTCLLSLEVQLKTPIAASQKPGRGTNYTYNLFRRHLLQLCCILLHSSFFLVHLLFLVIAFGNWEQKITFPIKYQTTISLVATVITTGVGTKLALNQRLWSGQALTVIHDTLAAWQGLGSALTTLHTQITTLTSMVGTVTILGYLASISILHVTLPAIISVEIFQSSQLVNVTTLGNPEFNYSDISQSLSYMVQFPINSLPWIGSLDDSQILGLFNGSLYEVLQDVNLGVGAAIVSATGINITCGYLSAGVSTFDESISLGSVGKISQQSLDLQKPIAILGDDILVMNNSVILYLPGHIIDSTGATSPSLVLNQIQDNDQNLTLSMLFLQCSKSLVHQSGTILTQTRKLNGSTLVPSIYKTSSEWKLSSTLDFDDHGDVTLLGGNAWSQMLATGYYTSSLATIAEEFLMDLLNIEPTAMNTTTVLNLHDIENALSILTATLFWIGGHLPMDQVEIKSAPPPVLLQGNTIAQQELPLARMKISLVARQEQGPWFWNTPYALVVAAKHRSSGFAKS
ncbi:hypothetical protein K438DRAFT_1774429 [Mycena galopus ATCC 62051]|nr:hypothetical protein K438DRAFT_1774429 [Mycena galopus ATCC 62051]